MPAPVRPVVDDLLDDLAATVPHLVTAVHLVGSAAHGDVHPGVSDLDLVVVLRAKPDPVAMRLLADVVGRATAAHPQWPLDLTWTTTERLRRPPSPNGVLVHHQLADHGLTVLGQPVVGTAAVATDPDALRDFCLAQIADRWTTWWDGAAVLLTRGGRESLRGAGPTAAVLGVVRLHHTLVTGEVLTPCAAAQWALQVAEPEWTRLLEESLRARHTPDRPSLYRNPLQRRRDALRFTDLLMTADEDAFGPGEGFEAVEGGSPVPTTPQAPGRR
ncbi:hypothetical protein GCM10009814_06990 [Lapillicoccus jejuensis]|uniref:Nucleotidyltransferase-like protein n=1 Tax=Lapillicoccus jejuensis TaxID=402171 RepID=A0A542DZV8_9MICO|nr:nucleotidyltransferase-like protein [Lapillicoccus jejuensis]